MEKMTREEMIEFLKGIDCRKNLLDEEKRRIRGILTFPEKCVRCKTELVLRGFKV